MDSEFFIVLVKLTIVWLWLLIMFDVSVRVLFKKTLEDIWKKGEKNESRRSD